MPDNKDTLSSGFNAERLRSSRITGEVITLEGIRY